MLQNSENINPQNAYKEIFSNSAFGLFHFNKESQIIECNDMFCQIIGSKKDVLININLINELKDSKMKNAIIDALTSGSGYYKDVYDSFTSGKQIPIIAWFSAIFSDQNEIIGGVGIVEDNSKQYEIEKDSRENEYYLMEAQRYSHIGHWKRNLLTNELKCSDELLRIYNVEGTNHNLPIEYFYNLIHPNDIKKVKAALNKAVANKVEYEVIFRLLFPDGTIKYVSEKGKSEYDKNGKAIYSLGIVQDITKIKRKESIQTALYKISIAASSDKSLVHLYKSIHSIIKELMPANNFYIAVYNEETKLLSFPYHVDEKDETPSPHPMGNGLSEYVIRTKKSAVITEEIDKQLQSEGKVGLTGEYTKIWVGIYLNFESNMKGVMVIQDYNDENAYGNEELEVLEYVSEQIVKTIDKKYADEKLKLSEQKLKQSNDDKDKFFSIISHDLKSPFQGIMGMSELLSEDYAILEESEKIESLHLMDKSIKNVYSLIEDLLDWARLQSGKMEFEPTNIDLDELISKTISVAKISAKSKNINIIDKSNTKLEVYADGNMITAVFRNLLTNAIKFSKEDSQIIVSCDSYDDKVEISIEDSGVGMNQDLVNKIFKLNEHYTSIGTNGEKGTGLGLILCKDLVEKNNGKIWVESELGKGSIFRFTIPTK